MGKIYKYIYLICGGNIYKYINIYKYGNIYIGEYINMWGGYINRNI